MRTTIAIIAGVALWGALWTGAQAALNGAMPDAFDAEGFPREAPLLLVFLATSVLLSALAGYLAAWIDAQRPMRAVAILAAIQLAIGVLVQLSVWQQMPLWYHAPFLAMVVPAHLLGGRLRTERGRTPAASGAVAH